jgi:hypothetical protein
MIARYVVPQQSRGLAQVDDQYIHVAVVVEVSESASATAMRGRDPGSRFFAQFFEDTPTKIAKDDARGPVRILR